jgi:polyisoprenyl-teichoic acid--peptidoglycan teichoic acid transferase
MVRMRIFAAVVILFLLLSSAQEVVAADEALPPAPPFAPHFQKAPRPPGPVAPVAPVQPAPEVPSAPITETPTGPAFNWSKTENYLVLGTDRREGWTSWRTDTVIILGLDRELNRAAIFSIPRDLYVQIPGYGWGRINQVDYLGEQRNGEGGGPALISEVLNKTLGISTQHWVRLQMDGFIKLVDTIGGVTVRLDCPFYEPIFNLTTQSWDYFTLPAGEVKLDGESAYWFVRLRYRESDIGRGRRQRQFLWGLRNQITDTNLIVRFPELWGAFQSTVSTDLGLLQIIELARYGMSLDSANVRAGGLTLSDLQNYTTEQGAAVLRIANPAHVRSVVEGIWNAPAMVDTNRQDAAQCPPLPTGIQIDDVTEGPPPAEVEAGDRITETAETTNPTP